MDLFDELDLLDSPATDSTSGDRVPRDQRCPDCGTSAYGPCGALNATSWRTDAGHATVAHCDCGRYLWYEASPRDWSTPGGVADWETLTMLPDGTGRIEPLGYYYVPDLPHRPTQRRVPGAGFPYRPKPDGDDASIKRWQARLTLGQGRTAPVEPEPPSTAPAVDALTAAPTHRRASRACDPHPVGP